MKEAAMATDISSLPVDDLLGNYVRGNDQAAFAEIYRRYAGMVYSIARRYLASDADAEDVVAACFSVLAQKAELLRGRNLGGWLYGRAMGMAGNLVTSRRRRAVREQKAADMNAETPEAREQMDRLLGTVEREIARLPEKQRQAIVLQYYQGMSGDEIAETMHCEKASVAALVHRGMERLRARFRQIETAGLDVESCLTSSALLLPVPASAWAKLTGIMRGHTVTGQAVELMRVSIREMLISKVKLSVGLAAAVGCGVAIPAVAVFMLLSGPAQDKTETTIPPRSAGIDSVVKEDAHSGQKRGGVLFQDDFENGLGNWSVVVAGATGATSVAGADTAKYISIQSIERNGLQLKCLVVDPLPAAGRQAMVITTLPALPGKFTIEWECRPMDSNRSSAHASLLIAMTARRDVVVPIGPKVVDQGWLKSGLEYEVCEDGNGNRIVTEKHIGGKDGKVRGVFRYYPGQGDDAGRLMLVARGGRWAFDWIAVRGGASQETASGR